MKPTNTNMKQALKIKRRLELVRTRIRELTPAQLGHVNGGGTDVAVVDQVGDTEADPPTCSIFYTA